MRRMAPIPPTDQMPGPLAAAARGESQSSSETALPGASTAVRWRSRERDRAQARWTMAVQRPAMLRWTSIWMPVCSTVR
jgi:hypothetical protein